MNTMLFVNPTIGSSENLFLAENIFIFEEIMSDKTTKRSVSLKSGKTILENHCQKHILSPVRHDQHPETNSLDALLTFNTTQNWGLLR